MFNKYVDYIIYTYLSIIQLFIQKIEKKKLDTVILELIYTRIFISLF